MIMIKIIIYHSDITEKVPLKKQRKVPRKK